MQIIKHKSKILFVDDDKDQINSLQKAIRLAGMNCVVYTQPRKALAYVNTKTHKEKFTLNNITQLFNKLRFGDQISTVISDYRMSSMNGIELLKKIKDKKKYKILYTGVVDEKRGIKELNDDHIDVYYRKGQPIEDLIDFLKQGEKVYFKRLVSSDFNKIKEEMYTDVLDSKEYQEFLRKLIIKNNICEYCLIDENGSFILINKKGRIYTLVIMSVSSVAAELDIAKELKLSKEVIQDVRDSKKMIYISKYNKFDVGNAINCKKLNCGNETIKYALIKGDIFQIINH